MILYPETSTRSASSSPASLTSRAVPASGGLASRTRHARTTTPGRPVKKSATRSSTSEHPPSWQSPHRFCAAAFSVSSGPLNPPAAGTSPTLCPESSTSRSYALKSASRQRSKAPDSDATTRRQMSAYPRSGSLSVLRLMRDARETASARRGSRPRDRSDCEEGGRKVPMSSPRAEDWYPFLP